MVEIVGNGTMKRDCETPGWKQRVYPDRLLLPESMTLKGTGALSTSGLSLRGYVCFSGSSAGPGHRHVA